MAHSSWRSRLDHLRLTLFGGGPGQCVFAINNACNAACDFCSFSREKLPKGDWAFASLEESKRAAEILYRNGVHYLVLTGGEPMMHPHFHEIASHARKSGMTVLLVTNGSLLNPESCRALKASGMSSVFISVDAHDAALHEKNRGLPKVCERIKRANESFRELGIQSTASVTMSRLISDYERLPGFLEGLGFEAVTFSYPLTTLHSSFLGFAESSLVEFSPEELGRAFEAVKALKRRFHVVNPTASLDDMQRFLKGEPQQFPCLGGYKYFYMDWNMQVWRCHHWESPMGPISEFDRLERIRDGCQRCMIDCMRDPSSLQHVAVSVSDALGHARRGSLGQAARALCTSQNASSLGGVLEQWRWFTRL